MENAIKELNDLKEERFNLPIAIKKSEGSGKFLVKKINYFLKMLKMNCKIN